MSRHLKTHVVSSGVENIGRFFQPPTASPDSNQQREENIDHDLTTSSDIHGNEQRPDDLRRILSIVSKSLDRLKGMSIGLRPLLESEVEAKNLLAELPSAVAKQVVEMQSMKNHGSSTDSALLAMDLSKCFDLAAVCNATNCRLDLDSEKLVCQICLHHLHECPKGLLRGINRESIGTFKAVQHLKNMKASIISHFASAAHTWCAEAAAIHMTAEDKRIKLGCTLGRLAYEIIREGDSYYKYERRVVEQHLIGTDVGRQPHTRKWVAAMLPCFHAVLVDGVRSFLLSTDPVTLKPRPFCIIADKVTELRRTGQVQGAITMVEGEFKAIFMADPPVIEGHNKVGVTDNIYNTVLTKQYKFSPEMLKQQLTGGAFDGQYFTLGVNNELAVRVGNSSSWLMFAWDGAHKLELVLGDVRADTRLTWYKDLSDYTAQILSKLSNGKQYEKLLKAAEALERR
eukprot:gene18313-21839_t